MEGLQEKAGESTRKPPGIGKKKKNAENKTEEPAGEASGKKSGGFFHRRKKTSEKESKDSKESKEGHLPEDEAPASFNAHALDMEPGVVIPPRQSLDLTYNDFTRESYEEANKPFVPKKKKPVPFELSETPRMQPEYWEGKTPGRRKLMNKAESAGTAEPGEEVSRPQEPRRSNPRKESADKTGEKQESPQKAQKGRQERKPPKENTRESKPNAISAKRQDQRGMKKTAKQNIPIQDSADEQSGDSAKESLMKPYWLKK